MVLNVSIILLKQAQHVAEGCHDAETYWPRELSDAVNSYRRRTQHVRHDVPTSTMLKLGLFALTRFDLVLYADLDVDVHSRWQPAHHFWRRALDAFRRHPQLAIAASADHSAPVNTGAMLLKPSRQLYAESMDVLRNASFDQHVGFDGVGRPRSLTHDLAQLAVGMTVRGDPLAIRAVRRRLRATQAWREDAWTFAAAAADQGLFYYLFYVRRKLGTWNGLWSERQGREAGLCVDHYWGASKPWLEPLWDDRVHAATLSRYLWRIKPSDATPDAGPCARSLVGIRRRLEAKGLYASGDGRPSASTVGGRHISRTPWLPEGLGVVLRGPSVGVISL